MVTFQRRYNIWSKNSSLRHHHQSFRTKWCIDLEPPTRFLQSTEALVDRWWFHSPTQTWDVCKDIPQHQELCSVLFSSPFSFKCGGWGDKPNSFISLPNDKSRKVLYEEQVCIVWFKSVKPVTTVITNILKFLYGLSIWGQAAVVGNRTGKSN